MIESVRHNTLTNRKCYLFVIEGDHYKAQDFSLWLFFSTLMNLARFAFFIRPVFCFPKEGIYL